MLVREALQLGSLNPLDQELLLALALGKDRLFVLTHPEYTCTTSEVQHFTQLIQRRETHEPLAYILGEKEFFGLPFFVNPHTLIPRPETELLVERALHHIQNITYTQSQRIAVIDVGTGSGCIIISLVKHLTNANFKLDGSGLTFFATDISSEALAIAHRNTVRHSVADSITFLLSNLLAPIQDHFTSFDTLVVVANLPYLSETLYHHTAPTVQHFEPATALVSGRNGLDHYHRLLAQLQPHARTKSITFLLEISPEQAVVMPELCQQYGAELKVLWPDLAKKDRVAFGVFST